MHTANKAGGSLAAASSGHDEKAWVVLLTRSSYLAATILLDYSLKRVKSKYPLHVLITSSLPQEAVKALHEAGCSTIEVDELRPKVEVSVVASRFTDTWDKLRAFGLSGFDRVVMLDADMLVLQNMDELLEMDLPRDWIAANHACVCNWSRDKWALDDWRPWNCAWTDAQMTGKPTTVTPDSRPTHTMLNSGLVVLHPSPKLLDNMIDYLYTSPLVKTFSFPDQDFITNYFKDRWRNVGWTYNAIKTARYWHPKLWRDGQVKNLHYIVAKPWMTPVDKWTAFEGDDRTTHGWWWAIWHEYKQQGAPRGVIEECERNMLGVGVDVGQVESWEESVEAEKKGRERNDPWPPGKPWHVNVDGVEW